MANDITPSNNPALPPSLNVPTKGDPVTAAQLAAAFQAILNGLYYLKLAVGNGGGGGDTAQVILEKLKTVDGQGSGLDADFLDGLSAQDFWKKTDTLPGNGGGTSSNADTLDGLDSTDFWKKSEGVNAVSLNGVVQYFTAVTFSFEDSGGYVVVGRSGYRKNDAFTVTQVSGLIYRIATTVPNSSALYLWLANQITQPGAAIEPSAGVNGQDVTVRFSQDGNHGRFTLMLLEL